MSLPSDNLLYPVLIEHDKGTGSGFYFRTDKTFFLVTAAHVLYDDDNLLSKRVTLSSHRDDIDEPVKFEVDLGKVKVRKNQDVDIAVIEIADYISKGDGTGKIKYLEGAVQLSKTKPSIIVVPPTSLQTFDKVKASSDVFILGYPGSLGIPNRGQIEYDRPLLRKGIVAGTNKKNKTVILDCPVYFGNSGGIVIQVNEISVNHIEYKVIGVVSQFIPFIERLTSNQLGYTNTNIENSGYSVAVPIDTILELTKEKPEDVNHSID